jgi:AraC-like DNA-binding protein
MADEHGSTEREATSSIAASRFCTDDLPPGEGFDIWRESISPLLDSTPERPDGFYAEVEAYHLGSLLLGRSRASSQQFQRGRLIRNRDGVDHFFVQLYLDGGYTGEHAGRDIRVRPGDVGILDLGMEIRTRTPDFDCLNLVIPRDLLRSLARNGADPGGIVFSGDTAMGRILANHIATVWRNLPGLPCREIDCVGQALLGVLAACLGSWQSAVREPASPLALATLEAMRDYIERNLDSPELTPTHLCQAFRCSRSFLYRLFEPEGGVTRFIQHRRLQRCHRELTSPGGPRRRIGEIACHWGFANQSHFCRLFHQTFGFSPKEAAQRAREVPDHPAAGGKNRSLLELPSYRQWLVRL